MKRILSATLIATIYEHYPNLAQSEAYRKLFLHLMFCSIHEGGYALVDRQALAVIDNSYQELMGHRYVAETFLSNFQEATNIRLTIKGYNYLEGKARMAKPHFHKEIEAALTTEIDNISKGIQEDMYNFVTGNKFNKKTIAALRKELDAEVKLFYDNASEEALPILEYLNDLPPNIFTKIVNQNIAATWAALSNIESSEADPNKRKQKTIELKTIESNILASIQEYPKPYYKPSGAGRTVRIFPHNPSMLQLQKDLRLTLTKGLWEYDLVSSQLAIVATLWNIVEVKEFLQSGNHIWTELFTHLGFNYQLLKTENITKFNLLKRLLKESLYSIIYGMKKSALLANLTKGFQKLKINKKGADYFTHPIIKALLTAREQKIKNILQAECLVMPWYNNKTLQLIGSSLKEKQESVKSLLAQEAQLMEMLLIAPVFELAKESKGEFTIVLFMHDGFTVHYLRSDRVNLWESRIKEAVDKVAKHYGILTEIEGALI